MSPRRSKTRPRRPKRPPRRAPDAPRRLQDGHKTNQDGPKTGPSRTQGASETHAKIVLYQRCSEEAPKTAQEATKTAQEAPKTAQAAHKKAQEGVPGAFPTSAVAWGSLGETNIFAQGFAVGGKRGYNYPLGVVEKAIERSMLG